MFGRLQYTPVILSITKIRGSAAMAKNEFVSDQACRLKEKDELSSKKQYLSKMLIFCDLKSISH